MEIEVIPSNSLESGPATHGMTRLTALTTDSVWLGEVRTAPGSQSDWHHHGDHTTYGYVLSGGLRFDFGPNGSKRIEAAAGSFFVVPPNLVHRESNPLDEEQVLVGVRIGRGPTVVNTDGPEAG